MQDLPPNTMYTYLMNPMFDKVNMSEIHVSKLAQEIEAFQKSSQKMSVPEKDALKFYFFNHAFHILKSKFNPLETLNQDMAIVAEKHIQATNLIAKRLFFYNLIIAVEEARFIPKQNAQFYSFIENNYGSQFHNYVQKNFPNSLTSFGNLNMTCGEYTQAMMSVFGFGKWQPGFGGKGWVPIAASSADLIAGNISFEQMADQAFSLCHNNGSMFNKGHFYSQYSHFIYTILDIQDSGQIPQWIGQNLDNKYVDNEMREIYEIMSRHFPNEMTGKVDMSLIKNSEQKRNKKAAALAAKNQANWNSWGNQGQQPPEPHKHKMDEMLVDMFKKGAF